MTDPAVPDDAVAADTGIKASAADAERRLHPMSWLFVLVAQLKQFIVPLVALLVFGQRADNNGMHELWPLVGVAVLALLSVWQYFTYRYGVLGDRRSRARADAGVRPVVGRQAPRLHRVAA